MTPPVTRRLSTVRLQKPLPPALCLTDLPAGQLPTSKILAKRTCCIQETATTWYVQAEVPGSTSTQHMTL